MNAYFVSHNGMGDNIYMIGALRFLLNFYEKIYFLCKKKYYYNVSLFFIDTPCIICIPFNENNELNEIKNIIMKEYYNVNIDVFICGYLHKNFLESKITNEKFLNYKILNKQYTIDFDTINSNNYKFIEDFYTDAKLNLTYFYEYFYLPSTKESIELYNRVSNYYIIFIQLMSSDGCKLNITNLIQKYINDDKVILICNDENLYNLEKNVEKYDLCQKFVYNKIINYNDTIINSNEIYIIDSCFIGIVLPYLKTNKLKSKKVRIVLRDQVNNIII